MIKFLSLLLVASLNFSAFASGTGYVCAVDERDQREIGSLRLPGYLQEIGVLTVAPQFCNHPHIAIYSDFCVVKGNEIVINLDPTQSFLVTRYGRKYFLACSRNGEVGPQPSHGGSNRW